MSSDDALHRAFGRVLKDLRVERGMSQETLGFASGFHRTYISQLERGQKSPSLQTLFDLARALNVRPTDLIRHIQSSAIRPAESYRYANRTR